MTKTQKKKDPTHADPDSSGISPKRKSLFRRFILTWIKTPLYIAFLLSSVTLIIWGLEKGSKYLLVRSYLGQVYPSDLSMMRRDFTRPVSHYDYDFVPGVCLEYNISKGNRFEYANNAGFREPRDISLVKPPDEYRIFLTGGSTAFGLGAVGEMAGAMNYSIEYRETISHVMEKILNASAPIPGKTIKVYNCAVWGYSYQHVLMRYISKLRMYNPDLVISLDGANEIPIVSKIDPEWNYFDEGQFNNIMREIYAFNQPGLSSYLTLWLKNNTFLMTYLWSGRDIFQELNKEVKPHPGLGHTGERKHIQDLSVEERSKIVDNNVGTVVRVLENYHSALENDKVTHMVALQPWFYLSKKQRHEKEQILDSAPGHRNYYNVPSDKIYRLLIDKITRSAQEKQYFLVDFTQYFDDVSEWVFTDWCHLSAGANFLIAKELANLVKEHVLKMELSPGDKIDDKDPFFWDLAASGSVAYAPKPDGDRNTVQNMLLGYPRPDALYSSVTVPPGEPLEVVLDMGRIQPVSRLRIVWGDENSVPALWIIEASPDKENWKEFAAGAKNDTDNFSRWPGFEHYLAEPIQARYIRYKPINTDQRSIKLRCFSVSR